MDLVEIEDMVYKFAIKYISKNDQERWISYIKQALPCFEKIIDAIYTSRLSF